MKSIIQSNKECFVCKTTAGLHEHHVFGGTANRKKSEEYGMKVWLCGYHHNLSNNGVHFDKKLDLEVKRIAQNIFEKEYGSEMFMRVFGKNYL